MQCLMCKVKIINTVKIDKIHGITFSGQNNQPNEFYKYVTSFILNVKFFFKRTISVEVP